MNDLADKMSKALHKAWFLGQAYGQQVGSDYASEWKKAGATEAKFDQLVDDTRAAILTSAEPALDYNDGVKAVVDMLEKRAADYAAEYGRADGLLVSFGPGFIGHARMGYYTTLIDTAQEVLAMFKEQGEER